MEVCSSGQLQTRHEDGKGDAVRSCRQPAEKQASKTSRQETLQSFSVELARAWATTR